MLDVNKLIASVEECLGWPYVSPGANDSRGIDCSGLFVKAYRDQGASIYHGSNTIYRKYCSEKGKLTSVSQLKRGMAVFKWNPNTPEKFNDGLGDFQHIGLVTSVNPLRIVHASSAAGCVSTDEKLGKWAYWGWLKDVAKADNLPPIPAEATEGDEEPMAEDNLLIDTRIVDSENDKGANLRKKPSINSALVDRLAEGTLVNVLISGEEWCQVKIGRKTGYVMTQFLRNGTDPGTATVDTDMIPVPRETLLLLHSTLSALLGFGVG